MLGKAYTGVDGVGVILGRAGRKRGERHGVTFEPPTDHEGLTTETLIEMWI